jgi:serine/threonine protein kinase
LVLEPMGPSVSSVLNAPQLEYDPRNRQPRRFDKRRTKAILRNVLSGLSFLHHSGVVHGDIQSGNMLFAIQDLTAVEARKLRQDEADRKVEYLVRSDGKTDKWAPKYLVVAEPLDEYVLREPDEFVKIIDMGGGTYEIKLNGPPCC